MTSKQRVLLNIFADNKSINDLAKETKLSREEILFQIMLIGRGLAYYELLETKVIPDIEADKSEEYMLGWNSLKQKITEGIQDVKIKRDK